MDLAVPKSKRRDDTRDCADADCRHWLGSKVSDVDVPHWLPYLTPTELGTQTPKLVIDFATGELLDRTAEGS